LSDDSFVALLEKKDCDMTALHLARSYIKPPEPELDAASASFLNHLRFVAMTCRAKRRANLFEACALLQISRTASCEAHADALMRCLGDAIGKRITLFTPGTTEISFDEAWLLQLGRALNQGDDASAAFLLNSRVVREHRRLVRFLVARISEHFSLI
jgi:hypothetical protein